MTHTAGTRSFWGWGDEGRGLDEGARANLKAMLGMRLGGASFAELRPPSIEDARMPPPRIAPPASLEAIVSQAPRDRASHTYGKAFRDVVRGLAGDFSPAPDAVAFPRSEAEVAAILDWCGAHRIQAIPFGGGSSTVAGVEARRPAGQAAVSIDMGRM